MKVNHFKVCKVIGVGASKRVIEGNSSVFYAWRAATSEIITVAIKQEWFYEPTDHNGSGAVFFSCSFSFLFLLCLSFLYLSPSFLIFFSFLFSFLFHSFHFVSFLIPLCLFIINPFFFPFPAHACLLACRVAQSCRWLILTPSSSRWAGVAWYLAWLSPPRAAIRASKSSVHARAAFVPFSSAKFNDLFGFALCAQSVARCMPSRPFNFTPPLSSSSSSFPALFELWWMKLKMQTRMVIISF